MTPYTLHEFRFDYEIPPGFKQKWCLFFHWERRNLKLFAKFTPAGRRQPAIVIHKAEKTKERYPWQQVVSGNYFLWMAQGNRLSSRYMRIAGTIQYEMSFTSKIDDWSEIRSGRLHITSLQRIVIPLVVPGDREYRLVTAAEDLTAQFIAVCSS
jgi:hypothetical protein